jgi:hypothetical protein
MHGEPVSPDDLLQMMTVYGLEHHYPLIRGHHEAVLREMAGWAGWKLLSRIDAAAFPGDDSVT